MERENLRQRLVEANSTGSQGSRRAVEPGGGFVYLSMGVYKSRVTFFFFAVAPS